MRTNLNVVNTKKKMDFMKKIIVEILENGFFFTALNFIGKNRQIKYFKMNESQCT